MKRKLQKQANELNGIICRRNLYSNGRRYMNAHISSSNTLVVEDLYTGAEKEFNNSDFVDGYGQPVTL